MKSADSEENDFQAGLWSVTLATCDVSQTYLFWRTGWSIVCTSLIGCFQLPELPEI